MIKKSSAQVYILAVRYCMKKSDIAMSAKEKIPAITNPYSFLSLVKENITKIKYGKMEGTFISCVMLKFRLSAWHIFTKAIGKK